MNSLCATAVLVLPVQSLLPPCMPPLEGGAPTRALQWHSLLFLTNCCASMLACSCHAPSSPPAPFLGSMFPVHLLGYYNYIFFCKFLFEHFVIVNKENETF